MFFTTMRRSALLAAVLPLAFGNIAQVRAAQSPAAAEPTQVPCRFEGDATDANATPPLQVAESTSHLSLVRYGDGISGALSGAGGAPIAGDTVHLEAIDVAGRAWPTRRAVSGTVPAGATTAVVGIRMGVEGACDSGSSAAVVVGGLHYREQGRPSQDVSPVSLPIVGAPMSVRTFVVGAGRRDAPNLKQFAVTPGAPFTFESWIAAPQAAARSGYAMVAFLTANGKDLGRKALWFEPSMFDVGSAVTDDRGRFHVTWPANSAIGPDAKIRGAADSAKSPQPAIALLPAQGLEAAGGLAPELEHLLSSNTAPVLILGPHWTEFAKLYGAGPPDPKLEMQWNQIASRIQAIRLTGAAILDMSEPVLAALAQDLRTRHIALGLEILATNWWHEPICGDGLEGYIDPGATNAIVGKLIKSNASLEFIAMDEPLWFGHYYNGKNACRSTIADLASRVAVNTRIYRAAFPNVTIGDIEPFPAVSAQPNWQVEYGQWVSAYASASASRLSFLDLDFDWYSPRLNTKTTPALPDTDAIAALARSAAAIARKNGLQIGMIMNGGGHPAAQSDADWIAQARMHVQTFDASGVSFDRVLVETWDKYPAHTFFATDSADTLAGLAAYYAQTHR